MLKVSELNFKEKADQESLLGKYEVWRSGKSSEIW